MLLFAHPGITLGVSAVLAGGLNRQRNPLSWFASLSRYLDIRWLLVGSLLPDIIDKLVGQYLFRDTFNNGRIFSHTLLFLIIVSALGFYLLKKYRRTWMLALAAGTFTHLVLDEIWTSPVTLFWPLLGFSFPSIELEGWASSIWEALFSDPRIYMPEVVGLVILLIFSLLIIRRKKVGAFLKRGEVS